jgi:hypothetical protein
MSWGVKYGGLSRSSIRYRIFLPGQAYLLYAVHESQQEIDHRRQLTGDERGLSRDLLQFRVYCTMEFIHQCAWQPHSRAVFLENLHGNLPRFLQQFCRAINQLPFCHSIFGSILSNSSLNPYTKLVCYTETLTFRMVPAWQPNLRLIYLWIFLNNWAYMLKQSCSPLFVL